MSSRSWHISLSFAARGSVSREWGRAGAFASPSRRRLDSLEWGLDALRHARHAALGAGLRQLRLEDLADARVLVLVLDLTAALLHVHVHAHEGGALAGAEGVAQTAVGHGQVARRLRAGVEVLVEHHV